MESQRFYAIQKVMDAADGRLTEHDTIVCTGSEIDCHRRIKELKEANKENSKDKEDEVPTITLGAEGIMDIQSDPEYFVVDADKYDEEHSLNLQRDIMSRFMDEFWK